MSLEACLKLGEYGRFTVRRTEAELFINPWGQSGQPAMEIKVVNNNVEKALRVAKKKLAADGLFRELKRRRFYEKPSVKKKAKEREAARRRQKWLSKRTFR